MTSRKFLQSIAMMLCLALVPALAGAQGKGKGKAKGHAAEAAENAEDHQYHGAPVFSERQHDMIRNYFRSPYSNLPPGLAKRSDSLPPGLEKQLERNGTLPPGLQKRVQPFPPDLDARLPRLPAGYSRGVIGEDAVILYSRTQRIVDIIHGAFGPR